MTPPECDLRDYQYMPVDIGRLFGSHFHSHTTDAEWRAGMTLWLKSYHQVPAGSMPDDDVSLARAAEFGNVVKAWRKVRAKALHGWVKCSDGRLYHPVVAEKALEGWIEKLRARKSSGAGNAKRHGTAFDPGPLDMAIDAAAGMLFRLNPNSRTLKIRPGGSADKAENPPGGSQPGLPPGSQEKGRETKEREEKPEKTGASPDFDSFFAVFPKKEQSDNARKAYAAAREAGATADAILAGAKRFAAHVEREKIPLKFTALAKNWLADGCWKDQYGEPEAEVVLPPLHPSWPPEVVKRWEKSLGQVKFRTYLGPAEYVDADPPRVLFSNTHRRRLAEEHCPGVAREVALELAA
jgi:hypothetical protein